MLLFLHIRTADTLIEDPDGQEFASLDAAYIEAVQAAREIIADKLRMGICVSDHMFEIKDEGGQLVGTLSFQDAIPVGYSKTAPLLS